MGSRIQQPRHLAFPIQRSDSGKHWSAGVNGYTSNTSGTTSPLTKIIRCQKPIGQLRPRPMRVEEECAWAGRILSPSFRQPRTLQSSLRLSCRCRRWQLAARKQMEKSSDSKQELSLRTPGLLSSKTPEIGCLKKLRKGRQTH